MATGERRPVYRTAGGRSAGAGGIEPASGAPATLWITGVSGTTPCLHDSGFCLREAPCGAARGGDGEHGNEQGAQRLRAARSQCSGVGAGEVNSRRPSADLPSGLLAGRRKAAKGEAGLAGCKHGVQGRRDFCRGSAEKMRAEGAALCATPREAEQRGRKT
ncbi:hypothetical protein [Xenorhabdus szentirmaii]|uniref:hypothetical protein n=1 Tax=Xenorhabdus szentirmaii TaxID=290112 RepID=UPI00159B9E96|nr:hypothetical protein [Xenorhabdus szentirmaii]